MNITLTQNGTSVNVQIFTQNRTSWENVTGKPDTFPPSSHTHPIADVDGLTQALAGKQTAGSYAPTVHTHSIDQVTGLQTALNGKQPTGSYATTQGLADGLAAKMPALVIVATYADFLALANPTFPTFYLVIADEVNFDGNSSIYSKTSNGSIFRFAAIKIN